MVVDGGLRPLPAPVLGLSPAGAHLSGNRADAKGRHLAELAYGSLHGKLAAERRVCRSPTAITGLDPDRIKVEFTQHSGDEMYHPHLGGFNADWQPRD